MKEKGIFRYSFPKQVQASFEGFLMYQSHFVKKGQPVPFPNFYFVIMNHIPWILQWNYRKQAIDEKGHYTPCIERIWKIKWWDKCILDQYLPENIVFDKIGIIREEDDDLLDQMLDQFYQGGQFKDGPLSRDQLKEKIL